MQFNHRKDERYRNKGHTHLLSVKESMKWAVGLDIVHAGGLVS